MNTLQLIQQHLQKQHNTTTRLDHNNTTLTHTTKNNYIIIHQEQNNIHINSWQPPHPTTTLNLADPKFFQKLNKTLKQHQK